MKPKTLQEAIKCFSDPDNCMKWLIAKRWPDGFRRCPTCQREDATFLPALGKWQCKSAHKSRQFSAKVGTIFEDSHVSLEKWLVALWMVCNCKNGISSWEIHRTVGVTQKTAWFMLHRIRLGLQKSHAAPMDGSTVEADETWVGGKAANMHKKRRIIYEQSGAYHGKTAIMGILDRENREIRAKVVPDIRRETLQAEIFQHVPYGANVYTDSSVAYDHIHENYVHEFVNHARQYVDGQVHTNGLENFWSLFKRNLRGTYVSVEPFHMFRYLDEQMFRFNNRGSKENPVTDLDRFDRGLSQIVGKRLTYARVTGKDYATC